MTSTDAESGHALPVAASAEGEFSNHDWDPGSYLNAVRQDLASAFAPIPSLPPAVQGTNPIAKPLRIQKTPRSTPERTPIHGRPIILRDLPKHTSSLLTQEDTSRLLRSLTQRDLSILQALHDYRYLNTLQIQQLFFHGIRSAQMRLHFLSDLGLLYRWQMIDPPGLTRRPSMLLLTPRGGRLLAEFRGHPPWSYIRRAQDARDHCWHVTHDLEANGFFIDLALASRLSSRGEAPAAEPGSRPTPARRRRLHGTRQQAHRTHLAGSANIRTGRCRAAPGPRRSTDIEPRLEG